MRNLLIGICLFTTGLFAQTTGAITGEILDPSGRGVPGATQDPRSNVYLLDGTPQNDFTNGPAGSAASTPLGTETIREFRVETNAYSANIQFHAESFNLFNRPNFGPPTLQAFSGVGDAEQILSSFGRIRSMVTESRQIQLGLRISF